MKKKKLNLNRLEIKSFVTGEKDVNSETIKGGQTFRCSYYNCTIVACPPPDESVPVRACPDWTAYDWCNTTAC